MCCVPTINVKSVTVNTTTNVATLALDAPLPAAGAFRLRFCNCSGAPSSPYCITPCTSPQAKVQFVYTPTTGTAIAYNIVYNCPECCNAIPNFVFLSQVVKQAGRCGNILHGKSSFAASGAVFLTDCLPCANVSISEATPPAEAEVAAVAKASK